MYVHRSTAYVSGAAFLMLLLMMCDVVVFGVVYRFFIVSAALLLLMMCDDVVVGVVCRFFVTSD